MSIAPCAHPRCDDGHGEPRLTGFGMCEPCRNRLRKSLAWLVMDWVHLSQDLPSPVIVSIGDQRTTQKVYGHPSEWASDTAAEIASVLNEVHDGLADHLGETPPPHPGVAEVVKVRAAWTYLECRIPQLADSPAGADTVIEFADLHLQVRKALGHHQPRHALPIPCPQCDLKTVYRTSGAGVEQIMCEACGWSTGGGNYAHYTHALLDAILDAEPAELRTSA